MIKKLIGIMTVLLLASPAVNAEINYACREEPYPISGGASTFLHTVTGANFFARHAAESIIKHNLNKNTGAEFDVSMKTFTVANLASGKFKSLELKTPEVNMGGLYVRNFQASTVCGYNHIEFVKDKPPLIYEDFILNFSATVNNDDLQKTLQSESFKKYVKSASLKVGGHKLIKIEKPQVQIVNNKIKYTMRVNMPTMLSVMSQEIVYEFDLRVVDGKLTFANAKINESGAIPADLLLPMINKLNPFKISLEKTVGIPSLLDIKNVNIINNQVIITGLFVAPKNSELPLK